MLTHCGDKVKQWTGVVRSCFRGGPSAENPTHKLRMTNGAEGISRWFRFRLEIHTPRPRYLGIYHQQKDLGSDTRFQFSIRCIAKRAELADIFLKIAVY